MQAKRIFYVAGDYWACGWYRCHVPGMELQRRGHVVTLDHQVTSDQIRQSDVVVFQRQLCAGALEAIEFARSQGKTVVYELDDDVWNVAPSSPASYEWSRPGVLDLVAQMLRRSNVVTTTTPALARRLERLNANVKVLPNMLPDEHFTFDQPKEQSESRVTIGWAGSSTHQDDLLILKGTIETLLDRYPQVAFVYAGGDEFLFEHDRVRKLDSVSIERYPQLLLEFDIGLAPVQDTVFNRSKSDLKVLEYAAVGIPTIASKVETYAGTVDPSVNGFLARNAKDWLKHAQTLIEDVELRRRLGRSAQQWARTRMISRNIGRWERAYGLPVTADRGERAHG